MNCLVIVQTLSFRSAFSLCLLFIIFSLSACASKTQENEAVDLAYQQKISVQFNNMEEIEHFNSFQNQTRESGQHFVHSEFFSDEQTIQLGFSNGPLPYESIRTFRFSIDTNEVGTYGAPAAHASLAWEGNQFSLDGDATGLPATIVIEQWDKDRHLLKGTYDITLCLDKVLQAFCVKPENQLRLRGEFDVKYEIIDSDNSLGELDLAAGFSGSGWWHEKGQLLHHKINLFANRQFEFSLSQRSEVSARYALYSDIEFKNKICGHESSDPSSRCEVNGSEYSLVYLETEYTGEENGDFVEIYVTDITEFPSQGSEDNPVDLSIGVAHHGAAGVDGSVYYAMLEIDHVYTLEFQTVLSSQAYLSAYNQTPAQATGEPLCDLTFTGSCVFKASKKDFVIFVNPAYYGAEFTLTLKAEGELYSSVGSYQAPYELSLPAVLPLEVEGSVSQKNSYYSIGLEKDAVYRLNLQTYLKNGEVFDASYSVHIGFNTSSQRVTCNNWLSSCIFYAYAEEVLITIVNHSQNTGFLFDLSLYSGELATRAVGIDDEGPLTIPGFNQAVAAEVDNTTSYFRIETEQGQQYKITLTMTLGFELMWGQTLIPNEDSNLRLNVADDEGRFHQQKCMSPFYFPMFEDARTLVCEFTAVQPLNSMIAVSGVNTRHGNLFEIKVDVVNQ